MAAHVQCTVYKLQSPYMEQFPTALYSVAALTTTLVHYSVAALTTTSLCVAVVQRCNCTLQLHPVFLNHNNNFLMTGQTRHIKFKNGLPSICIKLLHLYQITTKCLFDLNVKQISRARQNKIRKRAGCPISTSLTSVLSGSFLK